MSRTVFKAAGDGSGDVLGEVLLGRAFLICSIADDENVRPSRPTTGAPTLAVPSWRGLVDRAAHPGGARSLNHCAGELQSSAQFASSTGRCRPKLCGSGNSPSIADSGFPCSGARKAKPLRRGTFLFGWPGEGGGDGIGDLICCGPDRIRLEVGIAGGGLHLRMSQQLADHRKILAELKRIGSE